MRAVGDLAIVRVQGSVLLSELSLPQPDIALLKPLPDFYRSRRAAAADALLVIEVSDSTLRFDLEVKVPLYARHGIPEVWIVDLQHDRLLFFRSLVKGEYEDKTWTSAPGVTPIPGLPDIPIDLSRLLEV